MRWFVFTALLAVCLGCSADDSSSECSAVPASAFSDPDPAFALPDDLFSVPAPEDPSNGDARWYVASPSGGLWVVDNVTGRGSALILPLNQQARQESTFGVDAGPNAPVFDDTDAGSDAAQLAIECAAAGTAEP